MTLFETISVAVVGGSALGATLAGFFAYRRGAREKVLSALVEDQERRINQLEEERDGLLEKVQQLESERQLPLTQLTELIVNQHTQQMASIEKLTTKIASVARTMGRAVREISKIGGAR